ncbi:hypothetical protein GCM10010885_00550 [Alicyclobacillus cellulosilyticus]|uniref:Uncharacterized protein n=1 Tax=Alicyclobacillus cellulosilyticus TaxID=1003997 RepID=A0A917K2B1_9BACL|nr:hypothetical protein [Alicyclobacillus cellulosilyticus]GGI94921.1 hypothetical protein GCM10010885_00550 [Alicyclobacillus cellulosilyticus]
MDAQIRGVSQTSPVERARPPEPAGRGGPAQAAPTPARTERTEAVSSARGAEGEAVPRAWSASAQMPLALLADPRWERTEWAWRPWLVVAAAGAPGGEEAAAPALWRLLEELAQDGVPSLRHGPAVSDGGNVPEGTPRWVWEGRVPGAIVPLQTVNKEQFVRQPAPLRRAILADRLRAAVRAEGQPQTGDGLFFPAAWRVSGEQPGADTSSADHARAVPWSAERWTRLAGNRLVHRVQLTVWYGGSPVRIDMLAAQPALFLHIATDDRRLQQNLRAQADALRAGLEASGWTLIRWSVGPLAEEADAP